jgi:hypothetical protein
LTSASPKGARRQNAKAKTKPIKGRSVDIGRVCWQNRSLSIDHASAWDDCPRSRAPDALFWALQFRQKPATDRDEFLPICLSKLSKKFCYRQKCGNSMVQRLS